MIKPRTRCECNGKSPTADRGCGHFDHCERRHAVDGEFLSDHASAAMCGGCRVLVGDDPDQVKAETSRARDEHNVSLGQLRLI